MSDKAPDTMRSRGVVPTALELTLADALAKEVATLLAGVTHIYGRTFDASSLESTTALKAALPRLKDSLEAYSAARVASVTLSLAESTQ
jgi:hypothetical protein